jgi:mRNA interferase HigB
LRVISQAKLRDFWKSHPLTEEPLSSWYKTVKKANWNGPNDIRRTYSTADPIGGEYVVFNILRNDYRLVVKVNYSRGIVYIWDVLTHREYDNVDFKALIKKDRLEQAAWKSKKGR